VRLLVDLSKAPDEGAFKAERDLLVIRPMPR
jgi:hypothetical protein